MMHYYFFKYWSRIIVGTMVSLVVIILGLFSYALTSTTGNTNSAQSANTTSDQAQRTYKKSVNLFGEIQNLKVKKQDTSKLEALYSDSVKSLSNQHPEQAEDQLNQLEKQITLMNVTLTISPAPLPSGTSLSGSPSPSNTVPSVEPTGEELASNSAETDLTR